MIDTDKSLTKKTYKSLGYTGLETAKIVNSLNLLLANYQIHYQKLRNFHWNVKGNEFFELHEQFELMYNEVNINIDEISERIRVFGYAPLSNFSDYLKVATIKEAGTDLDGTAMVIEIVSDYQSLLSFMVDVTDAAIEIGDVGTQELINTYIKNIEKKHWMLNAYLNT